MHNHTHTLYLFLSFFLSFFLCVCEVVFGFPASHHSSARPQVQRAFSFFVYKNVEPFTWRYSVAPKTFETHKTRSRAWPWRLLTCWLSPLPSWPSKFSPDLSTGLEEGVRVNPSASPSSAPWTTSPRRRSSEMFANRSLCEANYQILYQNPRNL